MEIAIPFRYWSRVENIEICIHEARKIFLSWGLKLTGSGNVTSYVLQCQCVLYEKSISWKRHTVGVYLPNAFKIGVSPAINFADRLRAALFREKKGQIRTANWFAPNAPPLLALCPPNKMRRDL